MSEHIETTIEHYRQKLATQEEAVRRTKRLINDLSADIGLEVPYPDVDDPSSTAAAIGLKGDEYHDKSQHVAARMILERRKKANLGPAHIDTLYDDLLRGGYLFDAPDVASRKKNLRDALTKASTVFHRLPNGLWGLVDWYESIKAAKKRKPGDSTDKSGATDSGTPEASASESTAP
jgi:hypothetical protein